MGFFFFFGFLNYFLFNYLFFLNASKMCQITDIVLLVYEKKKKRNENHAEWRNVGLLRKNYFVFG